MKNVNIMGVHQFLGEGVTKKKDNIYMEPPKRGLGQFAEGLVENKEEGTSEGGGGAVDTSLHSHYDLILIHAGT